VESLTLNLNRYVDDLVDLWERYVKVDETMPNAVLQHTSKEKFSAELSREDTVRILHETEELSRKVSDALRPLYADLREAQEFVGDK
jgi:hypothetical protein